MIRRRLVRLIAVLGIALAIFFSVRAIYRVSAPQVVIFVVMDTLRADRASLCGYELPTTPTLEALVDQGASYACNSHSASTWTLPSHATLFTGVGPEEHQVGLGGPTKGMTFGAVTTLGDRWPTLAEDMSARGYQTLLLSGNPVVGERMGLTRGFGHAVVARSFPEMHDHRLADRLKLILQYLGLDRGRPLFVFINIADPHSPWREIPADLGFLPARDALMADPERARYESGEMSDEEAERWLSHLSDVYDFSVLRADRSLALVLEALRAKGWLDGEYRLVITSDHGEYLGEHQMVEHGRRFFYEPVTRVPLLYFSSRGQIELPNDVPSSVAYWLARDGALPEPLPQNVASVFRKGSASVDSALPCAVSSAALWLDRYSKLVAYQGEVSRFDLLSDPEELHPIPAGNHPSAPVLLNYCRALDRAHALRPGPDAELSDEVSAQLKALGYLRNEEESQPDSQSQD